MSDLGENTTSCSISRPCINCTHDFVPSVRHNILGNTTETIQRHSSTSNHEDYSSRQGWRSQALADFAGQQILTLGETLPNNAWFVNRPTPTIYDNKFEISDLAHSQSFRESEDASSSEKPQKPLPNLGFPISISVTTDDESDSEKMSLHRSDRETSEVLEEYQNSQFSSRSERYLLTTSVKNESDDESNDSGSSCRLSHGDAPDGRLHEDVVTPTIDGIIVEINLPVHLTKPLPTVLQNHPLQPFGVESIHKDLRGSKNHRALRLTAVLDHFTILDIHPIRDEIDRGLNVVLSYIDPYWIQSTFLPLRAHYIKFAFLQLQRIVWPILAFELTPDERERLLQQAMHTWIRYSLQFELQLIDMYEELQEVIRSTPFFFDTSARANAFTSKQEANIWMHKHMYERIEPTIERYYEASTGVRALSQQWTGELSELRRVLTTHLPESLPIVDTIVSYQPHFQQMTLFVGGQVAPILEEDRYLFLWLPSKVPLPQENVINIVREDGAAYDKAFKTVLTE